MRPKTFEVKPKLAFIVSRDNLKIAATFLKNVLALLKLQNVQVKIQIQLQNGQAPFWYACTMCDEINNVQDATRNKTILKLI